MEEEKDKKGFTGRDFGSKTIPILGELESRTKEGITAAAGTIYDYAKEKFQQTINEEYGQQIESLNNSFSEVVQDDIIPRLAEAEEKVDNIIPYIIVYENQYVNIPCDAYGNCLDDSSNIETKVKLYHGNIVENLAETNGIIVDSQGSEYQYILDEQSGDNSFASLSILGSKVKFLQDLTEVDFHLVGESETIVYGKIFFNKVKQGKSAFEEWKDQNPTERANATPAMFILDLKNVDGVYGPKYAPDETAAISDADGSTVVYFIPNDEDSTKYDIVLVEGGEAKPLATEISGDITNYAGIYDVSADHDNTPYATLALAVAAISNTAKKGGMTIKFIQGTGADAKYVQYRLLRTAFPSEFSEDDWEIAGEAGEVEDDVIENSSNPISSDAVYSALNGRVRNYTTNKRIKNNTGALIAEYSDYPTNVSDYFAVTTGDRIKWCYAEAPLPSNYELYIGLYDSNKNYVATSQCTSGSVERSFPIGASNVAYGRITFHAVDGYTPYVKVNGVVVWERKDEIEGLKNNLKQYTDEKTSAVFEVFGNDADILNLSCWEQGAISSSEGTNTDNDNRIRLKDIHYANDDFTLSPNDGFQIFVMYYNESGVFIGSSGWNTTDVTIHAGEYYRLTYAYTESVAIQVSQEALDEVEFLQSSFGTRIAESRKRESTFGGNLFILSQVTAPSTGLTMVKSFEANSVTVSPKNNTSLGLCISFPTLIVGKKYLISFDYDTQVKGTIALRASNNTAVIILIDNINGSGHFEGSFIYDSTMVRLGMTVSSSQNKELTFSNVDVREIGSEVLDTIEDVDLNDVSKFVGTITAQLKWAFSRQYVESASFYLIDVSNHAGGQAIITTEANSVFAFLKSSSHANGEEVKFADNTTRIYVQNAEDAAIYIPDDAKCMYVSSTNLAGDSNSPTSIMLVGGCQKYVKHITDGRKLIQKRILQNVNIRWKALLDICGSSYLPAGEQVGIPYSSCIEVDRYVGHDVSVKTFMTCANNPYSLLYTENLRTRQSGYGFTYVGDRTPIRSWMGTVCSRFVFSALGYTEWDTIHFAWLCKQGFFVKKESQLSEDVDVGDVIWIPGHTRIIYDVTKVGGKNVKIVVTEANLPIVKTTDYTPSTLDAYMHTSTYNGIFYRCTADSSFYEPSLFVNNLGEPLPDDYVYNDDICTYAGDYAAFRVGYPIWLNYNLKEVGAWTQIQLFKESVNSNNKLTLTLVQTYSIDSSIHRLQIPQADITAYGKYRARLTDGTNYSDYTYFEVIETSVSVSTVDSNIKRVEFSSANGTPQKVVFCEEDGTPMAVRQLSIQERQDGFVEVNPSRICLEQRGENLPENVYLRVYFTGEYGRVTNEQITV